MENTVFVLLTLFTIVAKQKIEAHTDQKRLLRELFEKRRYNALERPAPRSNESVTVTLGFTWQQIITLDEKNQFLLSSVWIDHSWFDHGLRWDPEDFDSIKKITVAPDVVWKPDIFLYNTVGEEFDSKSPVNVVLNYDGTVAYIPPAILQSTCTINIQWFPFDQQFCKLKFGSWTFDEALLNITRKQPPVAWDGYIENGEWVISSARVKRNSVKYDCCPEVYPDITVYIHLRRLSLYYYFNLIIPTALTSVMALLVFTLPVDSGEKMGLSVTILLSLTVFMNTVSEKMPRSSEALPLLSLYFACIMFICSVALITSVWVLNLHHFPHVTDEPPKWVRTGLCLYMAKILGMRVPTELGGLLETGNIVGDGPSLKQIGYASIEQLININKQLQIAKLSNVTEDLANCNCGRHSPEIELETLHLAAKARLPSVRSSKSYSNTYSNQFQDLAATNGLAIESLVHKPQCYGKRKTPPNANNSAVQAHSPMANRGIDADQWKMLCAHLQAILRELEVIAGKIRSESKSDKYRLLWRFAAQVVDRLCLLVFSVVNIVCTIIMLVIAPTMNNRLIFAPPDFPATDDL